MNVFLYSCRIASLLFARDCVLPIDALMAPLRGFDKLWSVAAVPQGTRDSRQGDIAVRAVVGQDSRSNGISCMSCNGSICPHRALACAILDVTSADLQLCGAQQGYVVGCVCVAPLCLISAV